MSGLNKHINQALSIAPLATFRVAFGFMMLVSVIRFAYYGWIDEFYIQPDYHFSYYGFEWVKVLPPAGMYALFIVMGISALMVMLGRFYKIFITLFFLSFTYIELIDKTYYLNHYYFVSLVSFIMIWLPANRSFSLDAYYKPSMSREKVAAWMVNIIKLQLFIVYFYAGLAKLNYDWLIEAEPLKIWLASNSHLPVIGQYMDELWVAYAFSWFGAIYDLFIPFLLINKKTRIPAFAAVIVFHVMTWWLFPIGMFPFIMILSTLIFFSAEWHKKAQHRFSRLFKVKNSVVPHRAMKGAPSWQVGLLGVFMLIQLMMPWRYLSYPGDLFWTEEGYRFSWRVMLMEKAGYVTYHIKDGEHGTSEEAYPSDYLTPLQEKMMSTQPDMILQFAHYLEKIYLAKGIRRPEIRVEAYATLNGSGSKKFIDPTVNLLEEEDNFSHKRWILPFEKHERTATR